MDNPRVQGTVTALLILDNTLLYSEAEREKARKELSMIYSSLILVNKSKLLFLEKSQWNQPKVDK